MKDTSLTRLTVITTPVRIDFFTLTLIFFTHDPSPATFTLVAYTATSQVELRAHTGRLSERPKSCGYVVLTPQVRGRGTEAPGMKD